MEKGGLIARMIENGNVNSIKNLPVSKPEISVWDKVLECGKEGFKWLAENGWEVISTGVVTVAKFLAENNEIFIIIGIIGMIVVIAGKEDFGKKLTSGSIIAYITCKGAAAALC